MGNDVDNKASPPERQRLVIARTWLMLESMFLSLSLAGFNFITTSSADVDEDL